MKTFNIHIIIIITFISTISFAQEEDWPNNLVFDRVFKNGTKISDLDTDETLNNVYGKNAYINNKHQKIFELTKFNPDMDQMISYKTGAIEDLKIDYSFKRDSTLFIYKMEFNWLIENKKTKTSELTKVFEMAIMDMLSERIFTTILIKYPDRNKDIYGWSEELFEDREDKENDITLPQVLRVKDVFLSMKDRTLADEPHDYVSYALWSKDSFTRYSKNGLIDKIFFSERLDSLKEGNVSTLVYKDKLGKEINFTNLYLGDNTTYLSTLDTAPFPYNTKEHKLTKGSVIVWGKANFLIDYFTLKVKLDFIGNMGFSNKELKKMEADILILKQIAKDLNN